MKSTKGTQGPQWANGHTKKCIQVQNDSWYSGSLTVNWLW